MAGGVWRTELKALLVRSETSQSGWHPVTGPSVMVPQTGPVVGAALAFAVPAVAQPG